MIYLLTAIGLTPGGSSTVHIYTQTIRRTTQLTTLVGRIFGIRTKSDQTKINEETKRVKIMPMLMIRRHYNIFNPATDRNINLVDSTIQYQIIQFIFIDFRNFEVTDYSVPSVRLTFISVGQ